MSDTLDRLNRGESDALDAFYRAHSAAVLRWVIRLGGPRLDPEDVAHEVFIIAFRKIGGFRGGSETAWLFGIARRVVANARRRAAIRHFIGLDRLAPIPAPGPDTETALEHLWRRRQVQLALERLDARKREVLVLMDLEEHTAPEVAAMLGLAVGTVYSRLHHARRAFRKALEPAAPDLRASLGARVPELP